MRILVDEASKANKDDDHESGGWLRLYEIPSSY